MRILRSILVVSLWSALIVGVLAMPVAVVIGSEDGAMPADQLWRKKALARAVLFGGGGVAALAACGLFAVGRYGRSHHQDGPSQRFN